MIPQSNVIIPPADYILYDSRRPNRMWGMYSNYDPTLSKTIDLIRDYPISRPTEQFLDLIEELEMVQNNPLDICLIYNPSEEIQIAAVSRNKKAYKIIKNPTEIVTFIYHQCQF